jgi:hypothetical protein
MLLVQRPLLRVRARAVCERTKDALASVLGNHCHLWYCRLSGGWVDSEWTSKSECGACHYLRARWSWDDTVDKCRALCSPAPGAEAQASSCIALRHAFS